MTTHSKDAAHELYGHVFFYLLRQDLSKNGKVRGYDNYYPWHGMYGNQKDNEPLEKQIIRATKQHGGDPNTLRTK